MAWQHTEDLFWIGPSGRMAKGRPAVHFCGGAGGTAISGRAFVPKGRPAAWSRENAGLQRSQHIHQFLESAGPGEKSPGVPAKFNKPFFLV